MRQVGSVRLLISFKVTDCNCFYIKFHKCTFLNSRVKFKLSVLELNPLNEWIRRLEKVEKTNGKTEFLS